MQSIDVVDSIEIFATPEAVFERIKDYSNIHKLHRGYRCKIVGDEAEIAPGTIVKHRLSAYGIPLSSFRRRIESIDAPNLICEKYIKGDLLGIGEWHIRTKNEDPDITIVSYHCKVEANNAITHLGMMFTGSKMHSAIYKKLLGNLKKVCEK